GQPPDLTGLTPPPDGAEPSGAPVEPPKEPPLENQYPEILRRVQKLEGENQNLQTRLDERSTYEQPSQAEQPNSIDAQIAPWTDEQLRTGRVQYAEDPEFAHIIPRIDALLAARSEERVYRRIKAEEVQSRAAQKVEERGYEADNPVTKRAQAIMASMQHDPEGFINRATEIAYIMAEHELSDGKGDTALSEFQRAAAAGQTGADVGLPAAPKLDDVELDTTERAQAEAHSDPDWADKMLKTKRTLAAQRRG
ncbi:hypothetical protein LCGC14_2788620, partial [marine sediment metagenome]